MATRKIVPRADNEGGIGTALKRWASAFVGALTANTIALIGGQLTFPATQAPSSDVNTLDDYEEGTWTPTITPGSGAITSYASSGVYTKIGRFVFIQGMFAITDAGTAAGACSISALPFQIGTTTEKSILLCRENAAVGKIGQAYVYSSTIFRLQDYSGAEGAAVMTTGYSWHFSGAYNTQ